MLFSRIVHGLLKGLDPWSCTISIRHTGLSESIAVLPRNVEMPEFPVSSSFLVPQGDSLALPIPPVIRPSHTLKPAPDQHLRSGHAPE